MSHLFLDADPPVVPSMNRVKIVDLPGLSLDPAVKNKTGYDLLSAAFLRERIAAQRAALNLPAAVPDLIRAFNHCLEAADVRVRAAAAAIAAEYGRHLAYLLLTLKRGDAINRAARPAWEDRHWAHWGQVEVVWLGGGLLSGAMGPVAVASAAEVVQQAGVGDLRLIHSPFGTLLPLVGMARLAPAAAQGMLVFDFGQTAVKRAVAFYEGQQLVRLVSLPSLPAECGQDLHFHRDPAVAKRTADLMMGTILETWRLANQMDWPVHGSLAASVACYLKEGHPAFSEDYGCYGRLRLLGDNISDYLNARVRAALGTAVSLRLVHDGTAAALAYAGTSQAAVLTFGTAIGVGFPPSAAGLRPVSPSMQIDNFPIALQNKPYA